jgi:hypothetical protein
MNFTEKELFFQRNYEQIRDSIDSVRNNPELLQSFPVEKYPHVWKRLDQIDKMSYGELIAEIEADYILFSKTPFEESDQTMSIGDKWDAILGYISLSKIWELYKNGRFVECFLGGLDIESSVPRLQEVLTDVLRTKRRLVELIVDCDEECDAAGFRKYDIGMRGICEVEGIYGLFTDRLKHPDFDKFYSELSEAEKETILNTHIRVKVRVANLPRHELRNAQQQELRRILQELELID